MKPLVLVLILLGALAMAVAHPANADSTVRAYPRMFKTVEEFKRYFSNRVYMVQDGDCDDRALLAQKFAMWDGYTVNFQKERGPYIIPGQYQPIVQGNKAHIFISATIGNELWYYEPSSGDVWKDCNLD